MFDFNGIVPASGNYGAEWPVNFVVPQGEQGSFSVGGWTVGNEGFPQQTFLGASIRSFSVNAGFGDSSSNVSIELVNDEYNMSDGFFFGSGDDAYHDGRNDLFRPPAVGSPVFFKFGTNPADVEQAFRKTFDDIYGHNTFGNENFPETMVNKPLETLAPFNFVDLESSTEDQFKVIDKSSLLDPENKNRGRNHFVFGGILQSYTENTSPNGHSLYNVNVVDPREILSDCILLFNNYQGTTYNNKNLFNIYGFLEYDPTDDLADYLDGNAVDKGFLSKVVAPDGTVAYVGNGTNALLVDQFELTSLDPNSVTSVVRAPDNPFSYNFMPRYFPITGQGLSRRSDRGIPFYRVSQALATMFEYYGALPQEYIAAGFGGKVNFRGFNYVVDFGGIPTEKIPYMYFLDFDQLDMLSFAQELCDVISHELFVSMLPIIDHPACAFLERWNETAANAGAPEKMIAGIIRLDAIDKTEQPSYGAIVEYLRDLKNQGVEVENQDVGFELSNVTTDKFVVGAQEVEMYFFDTSHDRDELQVRREAQGQTALEILKQDQWLLETNLKQSVLPFYGFLGENNALSIPRGWGAYQQILLDTTGLNAFGVGNYYVATELELRSALVSYDRWKNFLLKYNDTYIQDTDEYNVTFSALSEANDQINDVLDQFKAKTGLTEDSVLGSGVLNGLKNRDFAVTVPRCVWDSDRPFMGKDGFPASPCSPPYGYPLYYKRATKIGIPEAGVNKIINAKQKVITNAAKLKDQLSGAADVAGISPEALEQKQKLLINKMTDFEANWRNAHTGAEAEKFADDPIYQGYVVQFEKSEVAIEEYNFIRNTLIEQGEDLLAETMNTLEGLAEESFVKNLPNIAKTHIANSKKVYEFIRKVAEENLGKKFLVKVPKACNARYQPNIVTYDNGQRENHIAAGPFGFAPNPTSSSIGVLTDPDFVASVDRVEKSISQDDLFTHYNNFGVNLANGKTSPIGEENNKNEYYTYGALKNSFNPISEMWEFNYKPEPQGGFLNYALYPTRLSANNDASGVDFINLPQGAKGGLLPLDPEKLMTGKGRVGCYVRYDNSHYLNFANVPAESVIQQSIDSSNNIVPDIVQQLPNVQPDQNFSFELQQERDEDDEKQERQPPSVAFVKCEVDEQFYMPPKLEVKSKLIYAREYELKVSAPPFDIEETLDEDGCPSFEFKIKRIEPVFSVPSGGIDGTSAPHTDFVRKLNPILKGNIIDTRIQNLDSNHVYALITVPGRIETTLDQRWADGPMQVNNTVEIKNLMTQDVVKIPQFSKPSFPEKTDRVINCDDDNLDFSLAELTEIERIQRQALKGVKFNQGEAAVQFSQPSPIYPNMVALPLMSWERCYGPWLSAAKLNPENARVRFSNIGGRIEFLKDENLAPWNFAGYGLMNEAGRLQAEFSNSLLLISERGGFVYPSAPSGIALARALKEGGPLVTSIDVRVGDSISTTVKLDLYTASYGKLQKQKEGNIATIARERQKIIDQNNNAIRRGLGKSQTSSDLLGGLMDQGGRKLINLAKDTETFFEDIEKKPAERLVISSDGRQSSISTERSVMQGMEMYNNLAQQLNALVPGGGPLPVVDISDVFDVAYSNHITTPQNQIPGADVRNTDTSRDRRLFGDATEGNE